MAKKKKDTETLKDTVSPVEALQKSLDVLVGETNTLKERIMNLRDLQIETNKRIDRLVDAHCKSKTLKGI